MRLLAFAPLLFTVANAMVIRKSKNGIIIDATVDDEVPTPTVKTPTKVNHYKRAKTTEYHDRQNITIFSEGDTEWDQDWFESSWGVQEDIEKVIDGVIQVELHNNDGFSLQSKTLQSQYGFISFDYKLSATDGQTRLNFISFNEGDYVNQGNYLYTETGYVHIVQEIKDHNKNTFISNIKRFAWQNYGNEKDFTLYLKNIVYRDIEVEIKKYDKPISVIDTEKCALSQYWTDISEETGKISFEMINGKCTMKFTNSIDSPIALELKNRKFTGGKLEIELKSNVEDSMLTWSTFNSENPDLDEDERATYSIPTSFKSITNEDFETEDEYNTLKFFTVEGEATYEIINFNFYPITADENIPLFDVTKIEEPDVILDSDGLHWTDASWGSTNCEFQAISSAMECSFEGKQGSWPGFGFSTENDYDGGYLVINMKVQNPDQNINILSFDRAERYYNIHNFKATNEYAEYIFDIPHYETDATYKFAIQEASQQDNIYYIRSIVYYPPYIPLPDKNASTTTKKKTTTKKTTTKKTTADSNGTTTAVQNVATTTTTVRPPKPTVTIPVNEPSTEEKDEEGKLLDLGYEGCKPTTKIVFSDATGNYGLENNEWCAILDKNVDKCWSILYGYSCCSKDAKLEGAWGKEADGTKCGNPASDACWAKEISDAYECCTRQESEKGIVIIDESGAWGVKNNKWCGIK